MEDKMARPKKEEKEIKNTVDETVSGILTTPAKGTNTIPDHALIKEEK